MLMFNMSENSSLSCSKNRTLHYTWIKLNKISTYKQDYRLVMCSLLTLIYLLFFLQKKIKSWGSKVSSWKGHHRGPKARAGGQGKAMA